MDDGKIEKSNKKRFQRASFTQKQALKWGKHKSLASPRLHVSPESDE